MEPERVCKRVVEDLFEKEVDPNPDSNQSEKQDPYQN